MELIFRGYNTDTGEVVDVVTSSKLCEADISDDVIVSYT